MLTLTAAIDRAEMRFRQLCCQESSAPLIAPMLFRELQTVLPFASCLYMWLGPNGPVDAWFNVPEVGQYLPLYAERYFRRVETDVWATTDEAFATQFGPHLLHQVLRIPTATYYRHEIYNEIFRPSNVHTFIRLLVRDGGKPAGTFSISRGVNERAFDENDLRVVRRLEPFIKHALVVRERETAQPRDDVADAVEDESGLLIVDLAGRICSASPSALHLLTLAQGSRLASPVLHAGLMHMIRRLEHTLRGQPALAVPVWTTTNAWGQFVARSYWLNAPNAELQIGVHLQRRIPRRLRMLANLHRQCLPPRQEQVALLLVSGSSEDQVARALGLTRNTVVYHRRQIYNRLEVDSRAGLIGKLNGRDETRASE